MTAKKKAAPKKAAPKEVTEKPETANPNMEIWDQVKSTDPSATKKFKNGEMTGTSIAFIPMIEKATRVWGPCGRNWGFKIIEERFDQGAPILEVNGQPVTGVFTIGHTVIMEVWHRYYDEERKEWDIARVSHAGATPYVYKVSKGYLKTDGEAVKKSITDAMKKCLSLLGFNADIYSGDFEDPIYVQGAMEEERLAKATNRNEEAEKLKAEHREILDRNLACMDAAVSLNELKGIYKSIYSDVERWGNKEWLKELLDNKDKNRHRLVEKVLDVEDGIESKPLEEPMDQEGGKE